MTHVKALDAGQSSQGTSVQYKFEQLMDDTYVGFYLFNAPGQYVHGSADLCA